jgi:hypothetical protein
MKEEHTIQIIIALLCVGLSTFFFGVLYGRTHAPCINYFNPDECELIEENRYICPSKAMLDYKACLEEVGDNSEKLDECFWGYNKSKD